MKIAKFFLLLFVLLTPQFSLANSECGTSVLKEINSKIGSLSESDMKMFFGAYGPKCGTNVEFSEWGNELLFGALIKQPDLFIKILSKQNASVISKVVKELESPIHDGIDLTKTFSAAKNVKNYKKTKNSVLSAIQIAGDKMGLKLN